jgi:hypothetical protein
LETSPYCIAGTQQGVAIVRRRKAGILYFALALLYLSVLPTVGVARATATPTPTPTLTPNGFNSNSNFSVNANAALPWPLPLLPTFANGTATPTLYAATPAHATDYAASVATATAQVGAFTGPINSVSTPVANLAGSAPTATGGDLNTGVDLGDGAITFVDFANDLGDKIGDTVAIAIEFITSFADFWGYSPVMAGLLTFYVVGLIIAGFIAMLAPIIQAVNWLMNLTIRLLTMFGALKP